jgi:class 3 adenylate cyclase
MEKQYAIMFADIVGSTKLYDTLGDIKAEQYVLSCIQRMTEITSSHKGHVIKTIGDEIMACFDSADAAVEAAINIQKDISANQSNKLFIRIGLNYGNVIERNNDLYGGAVNVAGIMTSIAKALQIITTDDLVVMLSHNLAKKTRLFDQSNVKGKSNTLNIYQVIWEDEKNITQLSVSSILQKINESTRSIILNVVGEEIAFADSDFGPAVEIGRDESCNITLDAQHVSRIHLTLGYSRGKFVLTDKSTNGTFVQFNGQDELFIRREELTLLGEGTVCLGEPVAKCENAIIRFSVLS